MITPPPTPVPSVMNTMDPYLRPAPHQASPSAAAFASLVTNARIPRFFSISAHSGTLFQAMLLL